MSCRVPDFVPEEDNPPVFPRKIPDSVGADFVESIWHKGPFFRRRSPDLNHADPAIPCRTEPYAASALSSHTAATAAAAPMASTELFMEEDEMASWLYYPLGGDDDPGGVGSVAGANPTEQPRQAAAVAGSEQGFPAAAGDLKMEADVWPASERPPRHPDRRVMSVSLAAPPPPPPPASRESTLVDSSATTEPGRTGRGAESSRVSSGGARCAAAACEHGPASSSGVSWEGEAAAMPAARGDERKRKGRNEDGCDSHSDDAEYFESGGERRSASARRARAAEVHNLSERRRRDRINEKMKALQQLIPRCHRSDKASMLDDAIEYMKSLQMQVQMMSMYCNMAPMMFPGVQQYMPSMGMGIPMGMGMGMGMGMEMASGGLSYPMLPFPTVMPGAQIAANGAAHLSQRLPLQAVRSPVTALADQLRLQGTTQADPAASSSASIRAPSAVQMPNLASVCHQVQAQNRAVTAPGTSKGANVPDKSKFG